MSKYINCHKCGKRLYCADELYEQDNCYEVIENEPMCETCAWQSFVDKHFKILEDK